MDGVAAILLSHVTSPTGLVIPVESIIAAARDRGLITVVDGAHAPGMVPLHLERLDADFYAGNGHKWMMAPVGAAFLSVSRRWVDRLMPLVTSWGWQFQDDLEADSTWGGSRWAMRIEFQGTQDRSAQWVLPEVIAFRQRIGEAAIRERVRELSEYARWRITETGLTLATPFATELSGAMVAFDVPNVDPVLVREWFWREGRISIPFTQAAGRTFLRVSTAWFNTTDEIDRLGDLIPRVPFVEHLA